MKKLLNILLLIFFFMTIMVPVTGIHVHKLSSLIFLLLSTIHTFIYRNKLGTKRWLLYIVIVVSFISGIFGMILEHCPYVLLFHRALSIILVFFLAIHIFVFHKKL